MVENLADGELGTAELLAAEVRVAALAEEALDAGAEDVGAVEEAEEDAAVDEGISEADPAPELTAVAGVTSAAFDNRGNNAVGRSWRRICRRQECHLLI